MKEPVQIIIRRSEAKEAPVEEISSGTYLRKNDRHYVMADDGDRYIFDENGISIRRKGADLMFTEGSRFFCHYPTPAGALPLTFETLHYDCSENTEGHIINLHYHIFQNECLVSEARLCVYVRRDVS